MKRNPLRFDTLTRFGLLLFSATLAAAPPPAALEDRGLAIASEWDARDSGWGDQRSAMQMILRNRNGQESKRTLRNAVLEIQGDGDKLLVIFDEPRDVNGTAFLTSPSTHKDGTR